MHNIIPFHLLKLFEHLAHSLIKSAKLLFDETFCDTYCSQSINILLNDDVLCWIKDLQTIRLKLYIFPYKKLNCLAHIFY